MAKKKTTEKALNIDNILFNCRDYLRAARNSGSFFEKRDMMLTLVFLRFIGEKYEDGIENLKQTLKEQGLDPEDENIRAAFFDDATFADGTYNLPPEARWSTITREKKDAMTLLSNWEKIDSRRYGIIINLFEDESPIKQEDKIFVKSIDYIKGMEGEKCLFILTNDLAAHLFNNNTETNKTKNKLYVALTRSLNELSIYILKEVEDKYTKKRIQDFFERYL